jgi:hypothetical protein
MDTCQFIPFVASHLTGGVFRAPKECPQNAVENSYCATWWNQGYKDVNFK